LEQAALVASALSLLLSAQVAAKGIAGTHPTPVLESKIVNGLETHLFPSTGMLVISDGSLCSGVLVGCQTFLTAAHCVCTLNGVAAFDGVQCNARPDLLDPGRFGVFFQHAGAFRVASVAVNPSYIPDTASDLALLRLAVPVEGIAPTPINTAAKPPFGTAGTIAGFGATAADRMDGGVKRTGTVATSSCSGPGNAFQICWGFASPGPPGTGSSTCRGDSGSPLFTQGAAGPVVSGIASFVNGCQPPATAVDSDVFRDRDWIAAQAGADLGEATCGSLPQVGAPGASVLSGDGTVASGTPEARLDFTVPAGTARLRVGLNGVPGNQVFLYAKAGGQAGPASFDCKGELPAVPPISGGFPQQFCEVQSPTPGSWDAVAQLASGSSGGGGRVQMTVTLFAGAAPAACTPDPTTLCIDDQPGDRRFQVKVAYRTSQGGGRSGAGNAVPLAGLGVDQGGLFWFFSPDNPEMLVKVIDGCPVDGSFWFFSSASTNVGLTTTVTDTATGHTKTYTNPDLTPAAPVADTAALPCGG
jgi:Trypsin